MLDTGTIRRLLEDRNLAVVAEKVQIHPNTLRNIKNGKHDPSYQVLKKLSDYLEAPIDDR